MKKLIAVLMSLCMLFCAAAAFAEGAAAPVEEAMVTVVNWSDFEAIAAETEGQFAYVGDTGLIMFIPAEFKDTEISDETLAGGTFMVLKSENEEKAVVNAQLVSADPDSFIANVESAGAVVFPTELNGLNCYQFTIQVDGVSTVCFAFATEQGSVLVFSFTPSDQEPYISVYKLMAASIQPGE